MMRIAFALANAFAWVFIFQYFSLYHPLRDAFASTALTYALVYTISCLVTPYAAARLRNGMQKTIMTAAGLGALAFAVLGYAFAGSMGSAFAEGIVIFALLLGLYRALYWVPYTVEVHELRPTVYSTPFIEIIVALMPALAGVLIAGRVFSPDQLFFAAALVLLLAAATLVRLPDVYEKFSWGYKQTFEQLFDSRHRSMFVRSFADGMQSAALFLLWPLAIFLIVRSSYSLFGGVLSATFLLAYLLRSPIRRLIEYKGIKDPTFVYLVVTVSAWMGRLFVASPFSIIAIDAYFHAGSAVRDGMDTTAMEHAADGGSYVDEFTALKEIGLGFGRITLSIIAGITAVVSSIAMALFVSFFVVSIAALFAVLSIRYIESRRVL